MRERLGARGRMSKSPAPPRSSSPPPSLPRELWAQTRIQALNEELSFVKDPRLFAFLELELGALYEFGLGEMQLAADCYLRARHRQPASLPPLLALARMYADKGRTREAAEVWQALAQFCEKSADQAVAL